MAEEASPAAAAAAAPTRKDPTDEYDPDDWKAKELKHTVDCSKHGEQVSLAIAHHCMQWPDMVSRLI